jgi:hypothetical protein
LGVEKIQNGGHCHGNQGVQPIPIVLAYLPPLDVEVVLIKFHQFLLGK